MQRPLPYYSCVDYSANVISYPGDSARMRGFYRKLDSLALFGKGNVNIVHIGGSHVQADVMSDRLRSNFTQCIPGFRAGRGMIFPYRAARTNNPANYSISYTGSWRKCQNSLPPVDLSLGISGIAVSSDDRHASISFLLNPDSLHRPWQYRHLRLMASVSDTALTPVLIVDSDTIAPSDVSHLCSPDSATLTSTAYYTYRLPYLTDHGTVALCPTSRLSSLTAATQHRHSFSVDTAGYSSPDSLCIGLESDNASSSATVPTSVTTQNKYLFTVNGFIPENDLNGITYHSLGVNGASLPSWLRCSEFGAQMHFLQPDLVILAVGVNDANVSYGRFDTTEYKANYNRLLHQIYAVNPRCAVLFVTNNDCVLRTGRHSHGANRNSALVAQAMTSLAREHDAALWDMYRIMGGLGSMAVWRDAGLANRDRVHFLTPGYRLLGDLLYNALIYDWLY